MAVLIGKAYNLVLDGGAISRPLSRQLPAINRRFMQVFSNNLVGFRICIGNRTLYLRLDYRVGQVRKGLRFIITNLFFKTVPIDRPAIQTRGRARFEAAHIKPQGIKTLA